MSTPRERDMWRYEAEQAVQLAQSQLAANAAHRVLDLLTHIDVLEAAEQEHDDQRARADENLQAAQAWRAEAEGAQAACERAASAWAKAFDRAEAAEGELKRLRDGIEALTRWAVPEGYVGGFHRAPQAEPVIRYDELRALLDGDDT